MLEASISTQEGSTSIEIEDVITRENEEKQLKPIQPEVNVISGELLITTGSPEELNTSQLTTDPITARYQTSGYRVYLNSVTNGYEEASGHEPGTVTSPFGEDIKIAPTTEEAIKVSSTLEERAEVFFSQEEASVATTTEEDANIAPTIASEEEANIAPTLEEVSVVPTFEEETNITPTFAHEECLLLYWGWWGSVVGVSRL